MIISCDIPGTALILVLDLQIPQSLLNLDALDEELVVLGILIHHQLTLSALVMQLGCCWLRHRALFGLDRPMF